MFHYWLTLLYSLFSNNVTRLNLKKHNAYGTSVIYNHLSCALSVIQHCITLLLLQAPRNFLYSSISEVNSNLFPSNNPLSLNFNSGITNNAQNDIVI